MSLSETQIKEIDQALQNVAAYELKKYSNELTLLEKSLLNPKTYTQQICPAYTDYELYTGPLKNKGSLYIHIFDKMVPYGWMISRKRYFKNKIRENSNV